MSRRRFRYRYRLSRKRRHIRFRRHVKFKRPFFLTKRENVADQVVFFEFCGYFDDIPTRKKRFRHHVADRKTRKVFVARRFFKRVKDTSTLPYDDRFFIPSLEVTKKIYRDSVVK